jgi:hypothetical protein
LINSEPRPIVEERQSNIHVITRGGTKTGVDVEHINRAQIQKVVPKPPYDLYNKRNFFRMQ